MMTPRRLLSAFVLTAALSLGSVSALAQEHATPAQHVAQATEAVNAAVEAHGTDAHGVGHGGGQSGDVLSPPQKGLVAAITTALVFLILLAILSKVAFGPIAAGLKKREDKIRQDIAAAEIANKKAQEALAQLNARLAAAEAEARKIQAQAVADAERISITLKSRAQQEIEEAREKSLRDIDNERARAVAEIQEQAVYLSTAIAEKILKRSINPEDQQDLVRSSLEQLSTVGRN